MNIQIFGKSKCFDTKKAERWFKERRIRFQSIDLGKYGISPGELKSVLNAVGLEASSTPSTPMPPCWPIWPTTPTRWKSCWTTPGC